MKKVFIFGVTGSIGDSALKVLRQFPEKFELFGVSCNTNIEKLKKILREFSPSVAVVGSREGVEILKKEFSEVEFFWGDEGLKQASLIEDFDLALIGISGIKGLIPAYYSLLKGKLVAIANKESMIVAGNLLREALRKGNGFLVPVDSEHSSIFQLLEGRKEEVSFIVLTASGGPFYELPVEKFKEVTPQQAVSHPNWKMGAKISVDSATLMNKGFEVIEASFLFEIPVDRIKVVIHPQSLVHGAVVMKDGSTFMHMSYPDMQLPIAYALSYPERLPVDIPLVTLDKVKNLIFDEPDFEKFPCLKLAYEVGKLGGAYPLILEAADEVVVEAFLQRKIRFDEIPVLLEKSLQTYRVSGETLSDIDSVLYEHAKIVDWVKKLVEKGTH